MICPLIFSVKHFFVYDQKKWIEPLYCSKFIRPKLKQPPRSFRFGKANGTTPKETKAMAGIEEGLAPIFDSYTIDLIVNPGGCH